MAKMTIAPPASTGYNLNPAPRAADRNNIFGKAPGQLGTPTSIYDQLKDSVPDYSTLTKTATGNIGNELNGRLSPQAMDTIQNSAAAKGVGGGYAGSQFQDNNQIASLGLETNALQHQGLTDYNQFGTTTGNQQLSPELENEVATQNSINAAAPDPAAAQSYAQRLFQQYLGYGKSQPVRYTGDDIIGSAAGNAHLTPRYS